MTESPHDEEIRRLVRRAYEADTRSVALDVEAGLRDVLNRVRPEAAIAVGASRSAAMTAGGTATMVATPDAPPWAHLEGRDRHAACMIAAKRGDREAFDVLIGDLTPLVWHVARGNGLARNEAEDVVQTVWLGLLSHIDRLAEPRALAGWLITTTRREANRLHRAPADLDLATIEQAQPVSPSPEDEVLRDDRDRRLWSAFHRLSQRCQELLRLTVLAGRAEYRAVAEALHMPHGSIGPTRGRCLNSLRGLYEGEGGR